MSPQPSSFRFELREDAARADLSRAISLSVDEVGQAAEDTARAWGWHLQSPAEEFALRGDVVKNETFALSRYRHTAASFRYEVPRAFAGGAARMLLACLEGESEVEVAGVTERLTPGRVLFANPEDLAGKRAEVPVSNLLVIFPRPQPTTDNYVSAAAASEAYLRILVDASASILSSRASVEDAAFKRVGLAVEALIWALATHTELRTLPSANSELARVYNEAVKYVALFAGDAATTVYSMATALGVSQPHLYRAFVATGETPSVYLRRARVRLAERLIADGVTAGMAARGSGFGTVRRMRNALASGTIPATEEAAPH
ncbi:helix-turn-helix domain-containing protein [Pseudoclavibacter sp. RFBG4]|uniref:helix-turn-helix domain-containing protein n=1 Tax=Pseudoclavibacter sp. RFBG4 TaxID=2080575 RepID=UPI0015E287E2|nr:helix-turn-helix domain-containing protein [Pseudoclavibacter sp. RFBG4]